MIHRTFFNPGVGGKPHKLSIVDSCLQNLMPDSCKIPRGEQTYDDEDSIMCGIGFVSFTGLVRGGLSLRMMSNMESLVFFTAMPSPSGRMRCAGGISSQPLKHAQEKHYTGKMLFRRGNLTAQRERCYTGETLNEESVNRGNIFTPERKYYFTWGTF